MSRANGEAISGLTAATAVAASDFFRNSRLSMLQNYENSVIARWIWQKFWDNLAKKKHCFDLLYCLRPYHYNSHDHQDKAKYLYRADGLPGGSQPAVVLHSEAKRQLA